jgi:uncharacterized phiE125 gp8 family phage protein
MHIETLSIEAWRPFSAVDLRANMRRMSSVEDTLLDTFITTSTRYVERRTQRSILGRTLQLSLPSWPAWLELPAPPLRYGVNDDPSTAVRIKYMRPAGTIGTLAGDEFRVYCSDQVWRLERGEDSTPEIKDHPRAVIVEFDVGWRSAEHLLEDAPELRDAIMLHASHRDANREATIMEPRVMAISRNVEQGFEALIKPYRVMTRYSDMWEQETI